MCGPNAESEPRRAVEGGEEAVARRVDLASPKADELSARQLVVAIEQLVPAVVAQLGGALRDPAAAAVPASCRRSYQAGL